MEKAIYFLKFYSRHKDDKCSLLATVKNCSKRIHLSYIFHFGNINQSKKAIKEA